MEEAGLALENHCPVFSNPREILDSGFRRIPGPLLMRGQIESVDAAAIFLSSSRVTKRTLSSFCGKRRSRVFSGLTHIGSAAWNSRHSICGRRAARLVVFFLRFRNDSELEMYVPIMGSGFSSFGDRPDKDKRDTRLGLASASDKVIRAKTTIAALNRPSIAPL